MTDLPITEALQASDSPMSAPAWLPWHAVGRVVYAQVGGVPWPGDPPIGMMDTEALASEVVNSHNVTLARVQQDPVASRMAKLEERVTHGG